MMLFVARSLFLWNNYVIDFDFAHQYFFWFCVVLCGGLLPPPSDSRKTIAVAAAVVLGQFWFCWYVCWAWCPPSDENRSDAASDQEFRHSSSSLPYEVTSCVVSTYTLYQELQTCARVQTQYWQLSAIIRPSVEQTLQSQSIRIHENSINSQQISVKSQRSLRIFKFARCL